MRFADRRHAGALLGEMVAAFEPADPVVYGLPRGGVPVAFEVARALDCPLDLLVVRKVGVPFQPELAMGAIAEGDVVVRNEDVIEMAGIGDDEFSDVVASERGELESRASAYRSDAEAIPSQDHTALVVDDGLATGSTALAAVQVLLEKGAAAVWLAVPIAPRAPFERLESAADRIVVLHRPWDFGAVGVWYDDFKQTTDDEVKNLLRVSRLA